MTRKLALIAVAILLAAGSAQALPAGFEVYFTDPEVAGDPPLLDRFIQLIDETETVWRGHFYQIDHYNSITHFLNKAAEIGTGNMRFIVDHDYFDENNVQRLIDGGVTVIDEVDCGGVSNSVESHNKFASVDDRFVWTGSWNMNNSASSSQFNNVIVIDCPLLAQQYATEFDEMWGSSGPTPDCVESEFSNYKSFNTQTEVTCGGVEMEVHFAPRVTGSPSIRNRMVEVIDAAQEGLYFCIFAFTSNEIANALIDAHDRGVTVQGVFEADNAFWSSSQYQDLVDAGIEVRLDTDSFEGYRVLHHKFLVADPLSATGATTITGSYNWTDAAEHANDENVLIIQNDEIAQEYYEEFFYCYNGTHSDFAPEIDLQLNRVAFGPGTRLILDAQLENPAPGSREVDLYVVLDVGTGQYWFYPSWVEYPPGVDLAPLTLPAESPYHSQILNLVMPDPLAAGGPFHFHGALLDRDGVELLDLDTVDFYLVE